MIASIALELAHTSIKLHNYHFIFCGKNVEDLLSLPLESIYYRVPDYNHSAVC